MEERTVAEGRKKEEEEQGRVVRWEGEVPLPPIPDTNWATFFLNIISQHGNNMAVVDADTGKHHTFQDLVEVVPRVRAGLAAAGVRAGDAVLLLTPNHIDFPAVVLATISLPATIVPISPNLTPEEIAHVLRVSEAQWVVVHEDLVDGVRGAASLLPAGALRKVWVIGQARNTPSLADLMRTRPSDAPAEDPSFDPRRTVALMQFTSGTTGLPKGIKISHRNMLTLFFQSKYDRGEGIT